MIDDDKAIAHVREGGTIHDLEEHLREVANRASQSADFFGAADWAHLAGIWHDLGKYQAKFQQYIRTASGLEAHIEGAPGRVDHSTPGALHAVEKLGPRKQAIGSWLEHQVISRFKHRIIAADLDVCVRWGQLSAESERMGRPRPVLDALLASTALVHDLVMVTRNEQVSDSLPLRVINPWT